MIHVGIFGSSGVGKTLWLSAMLGIPRTDTIGIDIQSYRFDGQSIIFYDTSGRIEYDPLLENTLDSIDCAIFVYDVSSRRTFADALLWMNRFLGRKKNTCALLGIPAENRSISMADVSQAARPWVRQGTQIWFDELEANSFQSILRFFVKTNTKHEK
jgi:GTPase SAR1 family protein